MNFLAKGNHDSIGTSWPSLLWLILAILPYRLFLSFILHGAQRALPCSRALRALLHDLNLRLLQYISNILITYLFMSVPSCFIFYKPGPGLCPSLAVSPGEQSSPLDLPFFAAPPRASSMTDFSSQASSAPEPAPGKPACSSLVPNGSPSPYCALLWAPPGQTRILIRREKSCDFSPPSAVDPLTV